MDRAVKWTLAALGDLEAAADYIARDSPHYAASLITELLAAAQSLSVFATRGRRVPELVDPDLRELVVAPSRLIYGIDGDGVWVLALIHSRRDFGTQWRDRSGARGN